MALLNWVLNLTIEIVCRKDKNTLLDEAVNLQDRFREKHQAIEKAKELYKQECRDANKANENHLILRALKKYSQPRQLKTKRETDNEIHKNREIKTEQIQPAQDKRLTNGAVDELNT